MICWRRNYILFFRSQWSDGNFSPCLVVVGLYSNYPKFLRFWLSKSKILIKCLLSKNMPYLPMLRLPELLVYINKSNKRRCSFFVRWIYIKVATWLAILVEKLKWSKIGATMQKNSKNLPLNFISFYFPLRFDFHIKAEWLDIFDLSGRCRPKLDRKYIHWKNRRRWILICARFVFASSWNYNQIRRGNFSKRD